MDSESKKMIEEALRLAQENNKMLHKMRRSIIWGRVMSTIYWVLIIGSAVGVYYYIQPFIDQILGVYGGAKTNIEDIGNIIDGIKGNLPR